MPLTTLREFAFEGCPCRVRGASTRTAAFPFAIETDLPRYPLSPACACGPSIPCYPTAAFRGWGSLAAIRRPDLWTPKLLAPVGWCKRAGPSRYGTAFSPGVVPFSRDPAPLALPTVVHLLARRRFVAGLGGTASASGVGSGGVGRIPSTITARRSRSPATRKLAARFGAFASTSSDFRKRYVRMSSSDDPGVSGESARFSGMV